MQTRTPDAISPRVLDLCRQINPDATPCYITIIPEQGCAPNDCFNCVREKVARNGGRIRFGWSIWECAHVYLEAENHAVYQAEADSPLLDITPSALPDITRRLFLPDDTATYDFENEGIRRDNVRMALADDPMVLEFFRLAQERNAILNGIPGIGTVAIEGDAAERFQRNHERATLVELQLGMKYTPQGAPCFCGSGKKFKRCPSSGFKRCTVAAHGLVELDGAFMFADVHQPPRFFQSDAKPTEGHCFGIRFRVSGSVVLCHQLEESAAIFLWREVWATSQYLPQEREEILAAFITDIWESSRNR